MMRLLIPYTNQQVNQLHDELLKAFPDWQGTLGVDGRYHEGRLQVEHTATEIRLTMPDGTEESAVRAVIAAHIPNPPKDWLAIRQHAIRKLKLLGLTNDEMIALGFGR